MTIDRCTGEDNEITKIQVRNNLGNFEDLDDSRNYNVTMNSYLANGGDGFKMIKGNICSENTNLFYLES